MAAEQVAAEAADFSWAGHVLERARWAARAYGTYDRDDVRRIVEAVARAAESKAEEYAEWAARETSFGVAEHKLVKNLACSRGILEEYGADDFVTPRIDQARRVVEVPRPAGVVLALTPSTNPVATLFFKVLLCLMTRNAVVISPHPYAKQVCADAARTLAEAAVEAGAPDGVIQWIEEPTIPLVQTLMHDERTNVILATGGTGMVRSAYLSGNPALGVGPGNVPVFVDESADLKAAARAIVESKAFDNSVLCTNESVLIAVDSIADRLCTELQRAGAAILDEAQARQLSDFMFPLGHLNTEVVGRPAHVIAESAGIRVGPRTKALIAPFDIVLPEEPLAHEKLSPVLGFVRVPDVDSGIEAARSVVRVAGAGHSAAIHSSNPETITRFAGQVPVLRVAVNVGNSTGSSGLDTGLAPTMTIGTGFAGRSSLGENLEPRHLVNWAKIAWSSDTAAPMPDFTGRSPWVRHAGPVPAYPYASNDPGAQARSAASVVSLTDRLSEQVGVRLGTHGKVDGQSLQDEVRRLVAQELSNLLKG